MLIAAIAHDVGHTAVNNQFLIDTSHELALMYNDHSPMENMHCAKLFQITSQQENNVRGKGGKVGSRKKRERIQFMG